MKQVSYEFRFYQDGVAVQLIVSAGRTARVSAIVGNRVYRAHYFDSVETCGGIRFGHSSFSQSRIECDLTLDGLRVRIRAELRATAAFASPLGMMSAIGLSAYNLSAPVVFGALSGVAEFGSILYNERAAVSVDFVSGNISEYRHSVVWGERDGNVLWLAAGDNRTLYRNWRYAAAYIGTPHHTYELKGPTRLTDFSENGSGMCWTLSNYALRLDVRLHVRNEASDTMGYRYAPDSTADVTLSAGGRVTLFTASMPATLTHLGLVRAKEEEPESESRQESPETAPARNRKLSK